MVGEGVGVSVAVAEGRKVQVGRGGRGMVLGFIGAGLGEKGGGDINETLVMVVVVDGCWMKLINMPRKIKMDRLKRTNKEMIRGEGRDERVAILSDQSTAAKNSDKTTSA